MEKHELSKIDFEIIEDAFKALLQSRPDPVTAADLRESFGVLSPAGRRLRKPRSRAKDRANIAKLPELLRKL